MAMFFVILGHRLRGIKPFFVFTSPVKIPMFFMISGYVFNYDRKSTGRFLANMFFKLVVPWLCLTVPFVAVKAVVKGNPSVLMSGIYSIISGKTYWYMPCLIVAELIWFFTVKFGKTALRISVIAVAVTVLGLVAAKFKVLGFAMINRAMAVQFFLLMGFLFKKYEKQLFRMNWWQTALVFVVYISLAVISLRIWPKYNLDVHRSFYYNYAYCFAMIIIGCTGCFIAAHKLSGKVPKIIGFLGQNTLVYYLLNSVNSKAFVAGLSKAGIQLSAPMKTAVIMAVVYVMCGIEALVLNRFLPVIVGKRKKQITRNSSAE